jgi:hyperosmotically inducible protein
MNMKHSKIVLGLVTAIAATSTCYAADGTQEQGSEKTKPMITVLAKNDADDKSAYQETKKGVTDAADRSDQTASDIAISAKMKTKMIEDPALSADDINVDTALGVVTLSGTVMSEEAKEHASELARSIEGVTKVDNRLKVGISETVGHKVADAVDDALITTKVKAKLIAEDSLSAVEIDVDTAKGVVTLSGRVASKEDIETAENIAASVKGVHKVVNRLSN